MYKEKNVLIVEQNLGSKEYIDLLSSEYNRLGYVTNCDVQSFLFGKILPNIVHIHWPESFYRSRYKLPHNNKSLRLVKQRLEWYKSNNVVLVYTIHNLHPHEYRTIFDEKMYGLIMDFSDIFVHHGNNSKKIICERYPNSRKKPHIVCPHGSYPIVLKNSTEQRLKYNLPSEKYVFLNFGRMRKNKGLSFTNEVFKKWSNESSFLFSIGPRTFPGGYFMRKVKRIVGMISRKNIVYDFGICRFQKVDNNEKSEIFSACDVVFLGHQHGLNSGILSMAASYGKPVVYPNIGNFQEQLKGWDWKYEYECANKQSALVALNTAINALEKYNPGQVQFNNENWLELNSWNKHVSKIIKYADNLI